MALNLSTIHERSMNWYPQLGQQIVPQSWPNGQDVQAPPSSSSKLLPHRGQVVMR